MTQSEIAKVREDILKKIEDLKEKITTNESLPHGPQDFELLVDIDDNLETCLNNWYY